MQYKVLGNGTEVVVKEDHLSRMVAVQCWVRAGSLHETPEQRGMAHLIEHMLFKGTAKRGVGEISRRVEACGGDVNAYTTFDRTVYYLTLSSENAREGVDILADAIFNSAFDEAELAREKEVVIEEIRRGLDSPGQRVGQKLFEAIYPDSEAGRPIIGSEESVRGFSRDDVLAFHRRWYVASNIAVVVVGDVEGADMLKAVEETFGAAPAAPAPEFVFTAPSFPSGVNVHLIKGDYEQPRLELAFPAPPLEHHDCVPIDLASYALGMGDASRLARRLRDDAQLVAAVNASVYAPGFRGLFSVSALPREDTYLASVEAMAREVAQLVSSDPVTQSELDRAKANLKVNRVHQEETVAGQAKTIGYALMTRYKSAFEDLYYTMIERTEPAMVASAVDRWLKLNQAVIIGLLPEKSDIDEKQVLQAFSEGAAFKPKAEPNSRVAVATTKSPRPQPVATELKPGVTLVYRHYPAAKLFAMSAVASGGLRQEVPAQAGLHHCFSGLMGRATTSLNYEDLLHKVEGMGAGLDGFSGKDSFGFQLHSLSEHVAPMLEIFGDSLLSPEFPEQQWQVSQMEILQMIAARQDQPAQLCIRKFQELIYGEHPYRFPTFGTKETVTSFDVQLLQQAYNERRDQAPWCIAAVGSLDPDKLVTLLQNALKDFTPTNAMERKQSSATLATNAQQFHLEKQREQTHIIIGYPALTWSDEGRAAFDIMTAILGGMGGRLFSRLRDQNSLAYTVSPLATTGVDPGMFGCYIACSPDKTKRAVTELDEEMARICEQLVDDDELSRAKSYLCGSHESEFQSSESQAMTMALMELYGLGYEDFLHYPDRINAVKADDIRTLAQRLVLPQYRVQVSVGP